jgi:hypothetical protein
MDKFLDISQTLSYLGFFSLAGALAFSLIVIFLFRSGLVFAARNQEGHLKKKIPLKGLFTLLSFLGLIIAFIVSANYFGLVSRQIILRFWSLFFLNFGLMLILLLYDTIVIDWLVIGLWRPRFLQLPDAMNKQEMKTHIAKSIIAGPVFSFFLAMASTLISYYLWMAPI